MLCRRSITHYLIIFCRPVRRHYCQRQRFQLRPAILNAPSIRYRRYSSWLSNMALFDGLPEISLPSFQGPAGLPGAGGNSNPLGSTVPVTIAGQEVEAALPTGPETPLQGANAISRDLSELFGTDFGMGGSSGSSQGGSTSPSLISDLFLRAVVIILGFIFTSVGLSMFKNGKWSMPEYTKEDIAKAYELGYEHSLNNREPLSNFQAVAAIDLLKQINRKIDHE